MKEKRGGADEILVYCEGLLTTADKDVDGLAAQPPPNSAIGITPVEPGLLECFFPQFAYAVFRDLWRVTGYFLLRPVITWSTSMRVMFKQMFLRCRHLESILLE